MNKTFILFCLFLLGATCLRAQTSAGNMMAGGTLEISSTSYEAGGDNDSYFEFSPSFGYFISDNFAIGAEFQISSENDASAATKYSTFAFGPFARYYKFTSNEKFGFFGQAQFAIGSRKVNPEAADETTKSGLIAFSLAPGAAYFFNEHFALEFMLTAFSIQSFDPDKDEDAGKNKSTTINFGLSSLQPAIGLRYHF